MSSMMLFEYKAREIGVKTVQVDPKNTSKKCSKCGNISDSNRDSDQLECIDCGYMLHSGFNACKNVDLRYFEDMFGFDLHDRQKSHHGGANLSALP